MDNLNRMLNCIGTLRSLTPMRGVSYNRPQVNKRRSQHNQCVTKPPTNQVNRYIRRGFTKCISNIHLVDKRNCLKPSRQSNAAVLRATLDQRRSEPNMKSHANALENGNELIQMLFEKHLKKCRGNSATERVGLRKDCPTIVGCAKRMGVSNCGSSEWSSMRLSNDRSSGWHLNRRRAYTLVWSNAMATSTNYSQALLSLAETSVGDKPATCCKVAERMCNGTAWVRNTMNKEMCGDEETAPTDRMLIESTEYNERISKRLQSDYKNAFEKICGDYKQNLKGAFNNLISEKLQIASYMLKHLDEATYADVNQVANINNIERYCSAPTENNQDPVNSLLHLKSLRNLFSPFGKGRSNSCREENCDGIFQILDTNDPQQVVIKLKSRSHLLSSHKIGRVAVDVEENATVATDIDSPECSVGKIDPRLCMHCVTMLMNIFSDDVKHMTPIDEKHELRNEWSDDQDNTHKPHFPFTNTLESVDFNEHYRPDIFTNRNEAIPRNRNEESLKMDKKECYERKVTSLPGSHHMPVKEKKSMQYLMSKSGLKDQVENESMKQTLGKGYAQREMYKEERDVCQWPPNASHSKGLSRLSRLGDKESVASKESHVKAENNKDDYLPSTSFGEGEGVEDKERMNTSRELIPPSIIFNTLTHFRIVETLFNSVTRNTVLESGAQQSDILDRSMHLVDTQQISSSPKVGENAGDNKGMPIERKPGDFTMTNKNDSVEKSKVLETVSKEKSVVKNAEKVAKVIPDIGISDNNQSNAVEKKAKLKKGFVKRWSNIDKLHSSIIELSPNSSICCVRQAARRLQAKVRRSSRLLNSMLVADEQSGCKQRAPTCAQRNAQQTLPPQFVQQNQKSNFKNKRIAIMRRFTFMPHKSAERKSAAAGRSLCEGNVNVELSRVNFAEIAKLRKNKQTENKLVLKLSEMVFNMCTNLVALSASSRTGDHQTRSGQKCTLNCPSSTLTRVKRKEFVRREMHQINIRSEGATKYAHSVVEFPLRNKQFNSIKYPPFLKIKRNFHPSLNNKQLGIAGKRAGYELERVGRRQTPSERRNRWWSEMTAKQNSLNQQISVMMYQTYREQLKKNCMQERRGILNEKDNAGEINHTSRMTFHNYNHSKYEYSNMIKYLSVDRGIFLKIKQPSTQLKQTLFPNIND